MGSQMCNALENEEGKLIEKKQNKIRQLENQIRCIKFSRETQIFHMTWKNLRYMKCKERKSQQLALIVDVKIIPIGVPTSWEYTLFAVTDEQKSISFPRKWQV